jgi:CheY-like chemotaxis protein
MDGDRLSARAAEILLVEDNRFDVHMVRSALKASKSRSRLHVVTNGEDATDFLHGQGAFKGVPLPNLILLDLNLPGKDGCEVLAEIKADPALRRIPVIVLTTSKAPDDVVRTYDRHVNCFITKPIDAAKFDAMVRSVTDFWLNIAELPNNAA